MTHIAALLPLIMAASSLLSCRAVSASILCPWTKVASADAVHRSFLRSDPQQSPPSLRLYHSVWSGERALLACSWSDDAAVIRSYLSLCRERTQEFYGHQNENLDLESVFDAEQCVSLASPGFSGLRKTGGRHTRSAGGPEDEGSEVRMHQRVKRGFIVPGTLWCGSGNKAPSFDDLGVFSDTDSCCREHDQCKDTILSFHSQFGVFNSNIFTMSHCNCDNKFRNCLSEANDSISDVVGYTFFNLLKMHCFTFSHQLQCIQRNWFGMCKETQMALYADVHPPTLYESTEPMEGCTNSSCSIINSTAPTELLESSTSAQLLSSTAASSMVPTPSARSPSITPATQASSSMQRPTESAPERKDDLENALPAKHQTVLEQYANITEEQMSCGILKELDECGNKILPQQMKFGLHNTEPRTMYDCNCTHRLFQTLAEQRQLTEVQGLLLGHVSQSCFRPHDCTANNTCGAVVVAAELPPQGLRSSEVFQQPHLQAAKLKARKPNFRRAKTKNRAVRLYKLCLRMTRPKKTKRARKPGPSPEQPAEGRRLV
ncbi:group 3 secretory phospholipase A2 isoform X2 [Melanotaenia boesemani]|uniref:group 3 secretory phospholipase A2 isoform X2 n=1 Tax=Melanotaenia boesemani TaxID=1250792 RepID=UPI001C05158E|nr:group 3 secretory phospholipase A2 isoform X2 [Melanotaenia boesemani]